MRTTLRRKSLCSGILAVRIGASLLCVVMAMSCTNKSGRSKASMESESLSAGNVDIRLLQGTWWREDTDSAAVFEIRGDSLYYTDEQDAPYFVNVKDNIFELTRDDVGMSFGIKKLTADSLIFHDPTLEDDVRFFRKD
jgi:hypothetical protein